MCPACERSYCMDCKYESHFGFTCEDFKGELENRKVRESDMNAINTLKQLGVN
jgi:hypothetical protein